MKKEFTPPYQKSVENVDSSRKIRVEGNLTKQNSTLHFLKIIVKFISEIEYSKINADLENYV